MKPQFQHEATTSFVMWLDHLLPSFTEAFSNKTGNFYYQEDDSLDGDYYAYASPYKQWVTDSGISDTHVPTYISGERGTLYTRESGIKFDFDNGRVLLPSSSFSTTGSYSGDFSVKDFNLYLTNETEEHLIIESKYDVNSRFSQSVSGIKPYDPVVPCIFILSNEGRNVPFAFGGEDLTRMYYRLIVFAENLYQLDGALSALNDCHERCFSNVGYSVYPINEYGDLKESGFSYADAVKGNTDYICIDKVFTSKISKDVSRKNNPSLFLGFVDMELIKARYPRI